MNSSPWHLEHYDRVLKEMISHAQGKRCDGWRAHFREKYPEQYAKYAAAEQKIIDLWARPAQLRWRNLKKL
jgi:hypothetical protein